MKRLQQKKSVSIPPYVAKLGSSKHNDDYIYLGNLLVYILKVLHKRTKRV